MLTLQVQASQWNWFGWTEDTVDVPCTWAKVCLAVCASFQRMHNGAPAQVYCDLTPGSTFSVSAQAAQVPAPTLSLYLGQQGLSGKREGLACLHAGTCRAGMNPCRRHCGQQLGRSRGSAQPGTDGQQCDWCAAQITHMQKQRHHRQTG